MFFWPHLELSEFEKQFVGAYASPGKPGVLRRTYGVTLNNTAQPTIPGLENIKLQGQVQISRASRVFALTFTGDINSWRLKISTASGTEFTPRFPNGTYPMVCSLSPAASWNIAAFLTAPAVVNAGVAGTEQISWMQLPLIIDPNWELDPNESLIFEGTVEAGAPTNCILEIATHVWEFPGMVRAEDAKPTKENPRMGAGPALDSSGNC